MLPDSPKWINSPELDNPDVIIWGADQLDVHGRLDKVMDGLIDGFIT